MEDDDSNQEPASKGLGRLRRMNDDPRALMAKGQGKGAEARKMGQRPRFTAIVARNTLRQQGQDAGNDAEGAGNVEALGSGNATAAAGR